MNSANRVPIFILMGLLVLAGSGLECYLADGNLATGWPNNVVRNWEQYGLLTLKGKMVANAGGFEALTKPEIYPGHRPASLYPVFLIKRLFAWTRAGALAFHVALGLALMLSIGFLLGRNRIAWVAGAAAILCPGYALYETNLDPNAISVLLGLPFAAMVLPLLVKPSLSPLALAGMFVAIAAYSALNWTTAFVFGMLLCSLVVARRVPARRLALFVALAGLSVILVAGLSVLAKRAGGASFRDFLAGYTWGAGGYGYYLTTGRAVTRLLFVGIAGLLPLLLVCGYVLAKRSKLKPGTPWWVAFSPLGAAVAGIAFMRNYFGLHPWLAAPVFLVGLVLSLGLLMGGQDEVATVKKPPGGGRLLAPAAFLAGCFAYGALVTILSGMQNVESQALTGLLRAHTTRSDVLVVLDTDATITSVTNALSELGDRRVIVVPDLSALEPIPGRAFLVSSSDELKLPLVARTSEPALASAPWVRELLSIYSTKIARRMPGNRGVRPGNCYLYDLKPAGMKP